MMAPAALKVSVRQKRPVSGLGLKIKVRPPRCDNDAHVRLPMAGGQPPVPQKPDVCQR